MTSAPLADHPAVGFIGLGHQGMPLAQVIADEGHALQVWARDVASPTAPDGRSCTAHDSMTALAATVDVVALRTNDDSDVSERVTEGLVGAMRRGAVPVNHGTGLPQPARQPSEQAAPHGVHIVDAPASGDRGAELARQLTTAVDGDAATVRVVTPICASLSERVIYAGPAGSGQYAALFGKTVMTRITNFCPTHSPWCSNSPHISHPFSRCTAEAPPQARCPAKSASRSQNPPTGLALGGRTWLISSPSRWRTPVGQFGSGKHELGANSSRPPVAA
ncbi:NAD(P)-binding domain-containing protein [Actinacidiphila glaucinigra]|uniref:NAD(P)-binding domain-containing protein n=1 Tax=Actinacidiphila glaucinigra TaxID=235986 RepID=UPI003D9417EE